LAAESSPPLSLRSAFGIRLAIFHRQLMSGHRPGFRAGVALRNAEDVALGANESL
jgi:hypothetical protein